MKTEKSCGAVVFNREHGLLRYVIIKSRSGIYGFPKGHVEGDETEKQTALREIAEETGLNVNIADGFRYVDTHFFNRKGERIRKRIVYFLAEYSDQTPTAQESEVKEVQLLDYKSAMDLFQFESSRRILTKAHSFLGESSI